jgi:hypothetical protein
LWGTVYELLVIQGSGRCLLIVDPIYRPGEKYNADMLGVVPCSCGGQQDGPAPRNDHRVLKVRGQAAICRAESPTVCLQPRAATSGCDYGLDGDHQSFAQSCASASIGEIRHIFSNSTFNLMDTAPFYRASPYAILRGSAAGDP